MPGLNPERADIIVAGLAVAAEVLARLESRDLIVSRYGIREGLLLERRASRPTSRIRVQARERSVREFAERCHYEEPHSTQVQPLALQLFDAIGARLGCRPDDRADARRRRAAPRRRLSHQLRPAPQALLPPDRARRAARHLAEEQVVIANVARYHRGAPPKRKHRNFGALDRSLRDAGRCGSRRSCASPTDSTAATSARWTICASAGSSARSGSRRCRATGRRRTAPRALGRASEVASCSRRSPACRSRSWGPTGRCSRSNDVGAEDESSRATARLSRRVGLPLRRRR